MNIWFGLATNLRVAEGNAPHGPWALLQVMVNGGRRVCVIGQAVCWVLKTQDPAVHGDFVKFITSKQDS